MSKQHSTAAAIDISFGTKTPLDPEHTGVGAELPSCHSGVDGPLAAADAVPRGSVAVWLSDSQQDADRQSLKAR